jgi:hypothetical protein
MRRLLLAAALPMLAGAGCSAGRGAGASPFPIGGRFLAKGVARQTTTLINGPAWATYCPSDSVLVIVALGRGWSGGLAVRTYPLLGPQRDLKVQLALGDLGTATAAFRAPAAGAAQVGVSGSVQVAVATTVSGRFDIALPDSGKKQVSIRGTLARIPFSVLSAATCSPP